MIYIFKKFRKIYVQLLKQEKINQIYSMLDRSGCQNSLNFLD